MFVSMPQCTSGWPHGAFTVPPALAQSTSPVTLIVAPVVPLMQPGRTDCHRFFFTPSDGELPAPTQTMYPSSLLCHSWPGPHWVRKFAGSSAQLVTNFLP